MDNNNPECMRFFMDQISPYEDGECPLLETEDQKKILADIIEKFHFVTKDMEEER